MKEPSEAKTRRMISRWMKNRSMSAYYVNQMNNTNLFTFVWKDKQSMRRVVRNGAQKAQASFWYLHNCGAIHIPADIIGGGLFAHELYHAARAYLAEVEEEAAANEFEKYTRNFWSWFYERFERKEGAVGE